MNGDVTVLSVQAQQGWITGDSQLEPRAGQWTSAPKYPDRIWDSPTSYSMSTGGEATEA